MMYAVAPVDATYDEFRDALHTGDVQEAVIAARRWAQTSGRDYRVFKLVETHYLKAKP